MISLQASIRDALSTLLLETGTTPDALFGDRELEPTKLTASAAYAMGIIEGAAIALGLTALELLDGIDPA